MLDVDVDELTLGSSSDEFLERALYTIDKGQEPMRVDKWLQNRIEGLTRSRIQHSIEAGMLTVNGKLVKSNYKVKPGDELALLIISNPEYTELTPEDIPLKIEYEDNDVLVINKPSNMVVHPGVGNYSGTLLNGVVYHLLGENPDLNEKELPRFGMVHRIDKNTTGLLVLAKTKHASSFLAKQFFDHTVKRKYTALVWGNVEKDSGTIHGHIGRHPQYRKTFIVYPDGETGKHATTHYNVIKRMNYVTLVECILETGRTHQIRVHMKHIGHTLFSDWEYGGDKILKGTIYSKYKQFAENCFEICPRCALHATTLGFIHPTTKEELMFTAPIPPDMQKVIKKWENYMLEREVQ